MLLLHIALWLTLAGAATSVACALTYLVLLMRLPKTDVMFLRLSRGITYGFIILAIAAMLFTIDVLNRSSVC